VNIAKFGKVVITKPDGEFDIVISDFHFIGNVGSTHAEIAIATLGAIIRQLEERYQQGAK
jgi:hypothetical protein